jgi:hypothetical protein
MKTVGEDVCLTVRVAEFTPQEQARTISEQLSPAWALGGLIEILY